MARFFIDRPVFAMVIAMIIVLLGAVAIPSLPIATYPEVVPPVVQITTSYLGGNAIDLEKTVAQPIEEQLVGLDGMLYYLSNCANNGSITISVTFKLGTNPDTATVQTQNRVGVALPRLPPEVQRQGVVVKKVSSAFLMGVSLVSKGDRYDSLFLANYGQINLVNQLGSLPGIGDSRLGSAQTYSMRVWVNPDKMAKLGLTATDVANAIGAQNRQNPAGSIGQAPSPAGTDFQYTVSAPGRLVDPSQFDDIILRAQPDASMVRIRDVGHTDLGALTYSGFSRLNGRPSANVIVYLAPGANATAAAKTVYAYMEQAKKNFPPGMEYLVPYDSTIFVRAAIDDVLLTLFEAIGLVILVVFLFLQNWRATLIPLLTVPVAVVGTFALFPILGFTINITSMFGLVLAIGIVVDDSIVVVEAVQRHIDEGMRPREATIQALSEVSAPVVAIAFILAAVFIPVAFLGGISGQIYKQFALTIAVSVLLSAFNALSLSPALSALILRPKQRKRSPLTFLFDRFNRGFAYTIGKYLSSVKFLSRHAAVALAGLAILTLAAVQLFRTLPAGFLPDEDQGAFFVSVRLPDAASMDRTNLATRKIESVIGSLPGVGTYFTIGGFDIATGTSNSNVATIIASLKPWGQRKSKDLQLAAILARAQAGFYNVPETFTFAFGLPPILGLSATGGFQFMLEDRAGGDVESLNSAADALVDAARRRPELASVLSTFRAHVPAYSVAMDTAKLQTLGIPVEDAYNALQTFMGGLYVNDFNAFGRTWQVLVQAQPEFRNRAGAIDRYYVRGAGDAMAPLGTFASVAPSSGPDVIYRYNRFRAIQILGGPAPGYSSGDAIKAMEETAASLPSGYGYEWTGTTYQQKLAQGNEPAIFGFASVLVFLFLAALYESWTIPMAVLFAVPLGMFGALLGAVHAILSIRYLHADRHRDADRPVRQERHSDRGVRQGKPRARQDGARSRDGSRAPAAPSHSDDQFRLHPGRHPIDAFIRRQLRSAPVAGYRGLQRNALRHAVGRLHRPGPLHRGANPGRAPQSAEGGSVMSAHDCPSISPQATTSPRRAGLRPAESCHSFLHGRKPTSASAAARRPAYDRAASLLVILLFAFSACTVGPKYKRPDLPLPAQFHAAAQPESAASIADAKWFDLFNDDTLKQLVTTAIDRNFDLRIAAERVEQARAALGVTSANQYPFLDAQGLAQSTRSSTLGSFPVPAGEKIAATYVQAGVALSWEIDFWGRLRRLTEAARAQYLATEEGRRGALVSLVSQVMTTYFQLLEQDLELEIGRKTRDIANDNLRLVGLRHDRGAATGLDVSQAQQLLYTATSAMAAAERGVGQTEDALSLLLGGAPATRAPRASRSTSSRCRRSCPRACLPPFWSAAPISGRRSRTWWPPMPRSAPRAPLLPDHRPHRFPWQRRAARCCSSSPSPRAWKTSAHPRCCPSSTPARSASRCASPKPSSAKCWLPTRRRSTALCATSPTP